MSSNALAAFHTSAPSLQDLQKQMEAARANVPDAGNGGKVFLRLDQEGEGWIYGADNIDVQEGSHWAINPFSFRKGWVCWADPKKNGGKRAKLGEVMGPVANPPACPTADHSDKGGAWVEQVGFDLICLNGEDEGVEVAYNTNSYGGVQAFAVVFAAVDERPEFDYCFPVVELKWDSYKNTSYNRTVYTPEFEVVDWANMAQEFLSKADVKKVEKTKPANEETEEAPAAEEGSEPAAAAEADAQEEAPRRRRRRRAAA